MNDFLLFLFSNRILGFLSVFDIIINFVCFFLFLHLFTKDSKHEK